MACPDLTVTSGEPRSLMDAPWTPSLTPGSGSLATTSTFAGKGPAHVSPGRIPQIHPKVAVSAEKEPGHSAVWSGL